MKTSILVGIVLIAVGVIGFVIAGYSFRRRNKSVNVGVLHLFQQKEQIAPIPPIVSGIVLVGGIVLVIAGSRSR